MKRKLARISTMLLLVLSCLVMFDMKCEAADGLIQISDASAAVGDTVNVTVKVDAGGDALGDCEATLTYDESMLEFVDGTHAEESEEGILLAQYGTGTETEFTFELQFIVLNEGKSELTLVGSTAYLYSDETLNLQATGGMISSEEVIIGEPVDINGTSYYFYEDFSEALILDGFSKSTLDYEGYTHNVLVQDLTGKTVAYFVKEDNNPILMMYDDSTASFVTAKLVSISNDYYLILIGNGDGSRLSSDFAQTTLEIDGTIFTAWQNMKEPDYFLVYALSSEGIEGFYQYDSKEGTYQRYANISSSEIEKENKIDKGILGKLKETVNTYFVYVLAGILILIFVFIIIIVVMSSIIGKRNVEIEDLYDELEGSDNNLGSEEDYADEYDEEMYDDYADEYDEETYDDYADEYDEEMYDDYADEYDEETYDDYEDEYEEEAYDDDGDELEYANKQRKVRKTKHIVKNRKKVSEDTNSYSVDFIDI